LRIQSTAKPKSNDRRPWCPSGCPSARIARRRRNRLEHFAKVEMGRLGKAHRFGKAGDRGRQAHLVDHLGGLPGARLADMDHALGIGDQDRTGGGNRLVAAAAHDRERAAFRAGLAAGDRCIDTQDFLVAAFHRDLAGDARRNRGVVDQHRAGAQAWQRRLAG
jgi:hypothetical protein